MVAVGIGGGGGIISVGSLSFFEILGDFDDRFVCESGVGSLE